MTASSGSGELMLMLLADARLPTGAHTQSAGLEPAMNAGVTVDQVPGYIAARLATVTTVEAGAAVVARHLAVQWSTSAAAGGSALVASLTEVDVAWAARTMSPAIRQASRLAARGYLRLIRSLWPDRAEVVALQQLTKPGRAVVLGVTAAIADITAAQLVRLVANDDVATIAAAVLKIDPIDPARTTGWVLAAHPQIEALAAELSTLTAPEQIPSRAAPLIEEWAEIHATTTQRLFRA